MTGGWKKLAERADKQAYAPGEVAEALPAALGHDWRAEVPSGNLTDLRIVLNDVQPSLWGDDRLDRLETLRTRAAGHPFFGVILDCAMVAVARGHGGNEALKMATADALSDRAARRTRQMEEHYHRKSNGERAFRLRQRIEDGVYRVNMKTLAEQLLGPVGAKGPAAPELRSGLDDGVGL